VVGVQLLHPNAHIPPNIGSHWNTHPWGLEDIWASNLVRLEWETRSRRISVCFLRATVSFVGNSCQSNTG
jgi:hypothetical protein